ncbi:MULTISPECIES: alpha/beta hydrolase [unclassified Rhodococcus (in: high G+C Gram-positive bacteria)]|uniref:alpha/beta hydrolase n=1 Tax=unclassified Rhodococcus (in: high G+C Gram-positive bacteria) TaxID=192944 RepID=UPI00163A33B4|nr:MULTISPECIES: alpha/beta hydrolase [unclassified Rhodococcus (in: high G+C Gram-positive bacteria)]MBC2641997.1 alpha/beta hydrolase [Rhodococcus sp. 3A]MBC2893262.1 alpha/beta hydrolase [Rhodococcus sp. 4CII]
MSTATAATRISVGEWVQRRVGIGMGQLPASLLKRLVKVPVNVDGEQMAPEIAVLMSAVAKAPDFSDLSPGEARAAELKDAGIYGERPLPMRQVEELALPGGLAATRYRAGISSNGLVVFFHGGGFVLGSRAAYDGPVRLLAQQTGMDILSVEYRLAPENPYPAPHDDAKVAWEYALANAGRWGIPLDRIVVAGDSAGGNVAAALAQRLRASARQPALQVLIYPVTDLAGSRPSNEEFADSPALTAKQIAWFLDQYLPPAVDRTDPRVSPLLAADLTGLPPTLVTVAGFDPLRDDGLAYAARLTESGVPTELIREPGLVHGYLSLTALSTTSREAVERIASAIVRALA